MLSAAHLCIWSAVGSAALGIASECWKCLTIASSRLTFASKPKRAVRTPIADASGGLMVKEIA